MICCTLLMQGFFNSSNKKTTIEVIQEAITYFKDRRGEGVENPDQVRFIYQFLQSADSMGSNILLQSNLRLQPSIFISEVIIYNFPVGEGESLSPHLCIYLKNQCAQDLVSTLFGDQEKSVSSRSSNRLFFLFDSLLLITSRFIVHSQEISCLCCMIMINRCFTSQ